jgi:hypothetical protein
MFADMFEFDKGRVIRYGTASRQRGRYIRSMTASVQLKKLLVVSLKGLVAKTK